MITLKDLELVGGIGMGAFGDVLLVKPSQQARSRKTLRRLMALKRQTRHDDIQEVVDKEIRLGQKLRGTPFVCQLLASFRTTKHVYILTEFYSGGTLQYHIKERTPFDGPQMALLAAELSVAIIYLHDKFIIHRDIRPDNILFDGEGHVRIIDLGISCDAWDRNQLRVACGTTAFLAPEMRCTPTPYDEMVDWWALGVTLLAVVKKVTVPMYMTGVQMKLGSIRNDYKFGMFSVSLKKFIRGLLTHDPKERLGAWGEPQIRSHPLFTIGGFLQDEKWNTMKRREFPPPLDLCYIPQLRFFPWMKLNPDDE